MIRKTLIAVSAVSALFLVASTAHAQTADEIVAKNLAAKGGIEKILAIQAIRTTGTMTGMGPQALTMVSISKPTLVERKIAHSTTASTTGTKTALIRSASFCNGALDACAFSTSRTIRANVVSAPVAVVSTVR